MHITIEQLQADLPAFLARAQKGELIEILVDGRYAFELSRTRRAPGTGPHVLPAQAGQAEKRRVGVLRFLLRSGGL